MPRIRSLKPDFFLDENLGDLDIQCRYAFAGLWCQADKEGRLKYESRKLKAQIFPYDNVKMDLILEQLSKKPFIQIYEVEGVKYIQIVKWRFHQNPHHTEKDSVIPVYNGVLTVKEPLLNHGVPSCTLPIYNEQGTMTKKQGTIPPTIEEVKAYCLERKNSIDAERWHSYYSANGWKVGKNSMKDWRAAVRTWEKSEFNTVPNKDKALFESIAEMARPKK